MQSTNPEHDDVVEANVAPPKRPRFRRLKIAALIVLGVIVIWGALQTGKIREARKRIQQNERENDPLSNHGGKPPQKPKRDPAKPPHPLDPALEIAYRSQERIRSTVKDYTATMESREIVSGKLGAPQVMEVRIRNRKKRGDEIVTPFSVYLKFLQPRKLKGREVIWVECQNDGKMIAHEPGFKNFFRAKLKPTSLLAMLGNRYPITEIGIEKMVDKLIQKGERDRQHGDCQVKLDKNATVDGVRCTLIRVRHPVKHEAFDFHIAEIYVDEERLVPLRYAAYDWPKKEGEAPPLIEEYTYRDLKLNVGLEAADFDPDNKQYNFP